MDTEFPSLPSTPENRRRLAKMSRDMAEGTPCDICGRPIYGAFLFINGVMMADEMVPTAWLCSTCAIPVAYALAHKVSVEDAVKAVSTVKTMHPLAGFPGLEGFTPDE